MTEIIYTFNNRGVYLPDKKAKFGGESRLRLIVKPHTFELKLSGEVIRSSSCPGYTIEVTRRGGVQFFSAQGELITSVDESDREYPQIELKWSQDEIQLCFGSIETVDYYPNCDGESDRWGEEWVTQREIKLELQ